MTRQISWRSGAVHEGRLALGRKWWGIIGALGAVGATAYLLPSLADGRHIRGGHLPEVTDIRLALNNTDTSSGTPLEPYSPPAEAWQNLPLLASRSSSEIATDGEVRLLALQAAFERERNSAAAAQLQVDALQEQLADLREKEEEALVLREQLADARAHAMQATEPRSAAAEQKKHADSAMLRVAALQEELASLSTEVIKAKTTAEGEAERADSALAQLEAVQHQLAVVTALQSDRTETESHLLPKDDGTADGTLPKSSGDAHPAEQASELPPPPKTYPALSIKPREIPLRNVRSGRRDKAAADKSRQTLSSAGGKPLARPVSKTAAAPVVTPDSDASRLTRPRHGPRSQNVQLVGKPPQRASQQPRVLAQDTRNRRNSGALSLPSDLLPDNRLW